MIKIVMLLICVSLLALNSCAPKKFATVREEVAKQFVEATPFKTLPEETAGEVVTGIGSSEKRANPTLMREAAITSAQADLARKVEAKVESVWKRTMADWADYRKENYDEAMSIEEMKTLQKVIVDTELRGPWQTQEFIDKQTGRYWVRIILPAATVEKWLKQRINTEALLKKYIIESQIKKVQEELQKDLDSLRRKEKQQLETIEKIVK